MRVDKAFSQARKKESKVKSCIIMQKVNPSDEKGADETHKMNDLEFKVRKTAKKTPEYALKLQNDVNKN